MMLDEKASGIPFAVCLLAFSHFVTFFWDLVDAGQIKFLPLACESQLTSFCPPEVSITSSMLLPSLVAFPLRQLFKLGFWACGGQKKGAGMTFGSYYEGNQGYCKIARV